VDAQASRIGEPMNIGGVLFGVVIGVAVAYFRYGRKAA
jgi:hypothetical protein